MISFVVGAAAALVMKWLFRTFKKKTNRLCIILGLVLLTFWGSEKLSGSALLACMSLGGVLVNITDEIDSVMETVDGFTAPAFMIFFVISGAGFEISALWGIGAIGLLYVVLRVIGKWTGSFLGGKLMKQETKICRYLGPTLMPQAGVALGLLAVASSLIPTFAPEIRVIILCSTFIYSLIGPSAAKAALVKSGEIVIEEKHVGKKPEKKPA